MSSPLEPHIKFWHPAEIEKAVLEVGMLPFFENDISGFSAAEHTPAELWFNDEQEGPWEWKGPIIQLGHTAYGKFFNRKAGWVALEWLPDLVNLRRAAYPLPPEDSQAPERLIYGTLYRATPDGPLGLYLRLRIQHRPARQSLWMGIGALFNA